MTKTKGHNCAGGGIQKFPDDGILHRPEKLEVLVPLNLESKTYPTLLFLFSCLYVAFTYLPVLYSIALPNENLQAFNAALEERSAAPPEAEQAVQHVIAAVGVLKRFFQVAYESKSRTSVAIIGPGTTHKVTCKIITEVVWFANNSEPQLAALSYCETDTGRKGYGIARVDPWAFIRSYGTPLVFLGLSLFWLREKSR